MKRSFDLFAFTVGQDVPLHAFQTGSVNNQSSPT